MDKKPDRPTSRNFAEAVMIEFNCCLSSGVGVPPEARLLEPRQAPQGVSWNLDIDAAGACSQDIQRHDTD